MMRISRGERDGVVVVRVEGKLLDAWLDELRAAIAAEPPRARLALDLSGLAFADAAGVALLRELRARGVRIESCSPFVRGLLESPVPTTY